MADPVTQLTTAQIELLRETARSTDTAFINPHDLRVAQSFCRSRSSWSSLILGRPYPGIQALRCGEVHLLAMAAAAEPDAPHDHQPPALPEPAHRPAVSADWLALARALPVPVAVLYNYSGPNHYAVHQSGAVHIVVLADLTVGRLHRPARHALCQTPSRSHFIFDLGSDAPAERDRPEHRAATCRECLRVAQRVARAAV